MSTFPYCNCVVTWSRLSFACMALQELVRLLSERVLPKPWSVSTWESVLADCTMKARFADIDVLISVPCLVESSRASRKRVRQTPYLSWTRLIRWHKTPSTVTRHLLYWKYWIPNKTMLSTITISTWITICLKCFS